MADDRIVLQGMEFYGFHGVNPEERSQGQKFVVDLELTLDLSAAGQTDNLNSTVNYASVFKATRAVVEGEPLNLIEAVAERIANELLTRFGVEAVRVRVRKPWAPIKGSNLEFVAVDILRHS